MSLSSCLSKTYFWSGEIYQGNINLIISPLLIHQNILSFPHPRHTVIFWQSFCILHRLWSTWATLLAGPKGTAAVRVPSIGRSEQQNISAVAKCESGPNDRPGRRRLLFPGRGSLSARVNKIAAARESRRTPPLTGPQQPVETSRPHFKSQEGSFSFRFLLAWGRGRMLGGKKINKWMNITHEKDAFFLSSVACVSYFHNIYWALWARGRLSSKEWGVAARRNGAHCVKMQFIMGYFVCAMKSKR